jgi:thioredoxin 1
MKRIFAFALLTITLTLVNCTSGNPGNKIKDSAVSNGEVQQLTSDAFKKLVFNYDLNKEWKYEGGIPAVIDFYADWCPPCRQLSPLVEELAKDYKGKIVVYKINTDKERELAQSLGISSLPTLLYAPANGKPQITLGYISKEKIEKTIKEVLLTR